MVLLRALSPPLPCVVQRGSLPERPSFDDASSLVGPCRARLPRQNNVSTSILCTSDGELLKNPSLSFSMAPHTAPCLEKRILPPPLRVFCGHWFHHDCLRVWMTEPPFAKVGNERLNTSYIEVYPQPGTYIEARGVGSTLKRQCGKVCDM